MYKVNKHRQIENESQRLKILRPKVQSAIQKLEKIVDDTSFECPVCLDTIKDAHILHTCLHRFCGACIKESLRKCNDECPKCREPIPAPDRQLTKDQNFDSLMQEVCDSHSLLKAIDHCLDFMRNVTQMVEFVCLKEKNSRLLQFFRMTNHGLVFIIVETTSMCESVQSVLRCKGFPVISLHEDKTLRQCNETLKLFRKEHSPIMIATDIAASSLDVNEIPSIVIYDFPSKIDDYIRSVGRAGPDGVALAFFNAHNFGIAKEVRDFLEKYDQVVSPCLSLISRSFHGGIGKSSKGVTQTAEYVEERDKLEHLMPFLLTIEKGLILIFVNAIETCDHIKRVLCCKGFPSCSLNEDQTQSECEAAIRGFKCGHNIVMIATDVAACGLDISGITHIINYDIPNNMDDYIRCIGCADHNGSTTNALNFDNRTNLVAARNLRDLLNKNAQIIPFWLSQMCNDYNIDCSDGNRNDGRYGGSW